MLPYVVFAVIVFVIAYVAITLCVCTIERGDAVVCSMFIVVLSSLVFSFLMQPPKVPEDVPQTGGETEDDVSSVASEDAPPADFD